MTVDVKINGIEAGNVLEGLTIRYGRTKSEGQFPASSCSIDLLALDESPFATSIRDVLTIDVEATRCFYGRLTDRRLGIAYSNATDVGTVQSLIATGVLADYGRITIGTADYPSESDGARASRVISEASPTPPSLDSVSSYIDSVRYSLDVFRTAGLDTVDSGTVTLLARTAKGVTARAMIDAELDPSAPGIYETPSGTVGYADGMRRPRASSPLTIPTSVISKDLTIGSGVADVVNQVKVTYGSPSASITVDEPLSQAVFGVVKRDITSQLSLANDASNSATRLVETRGFAEDNLEALPIDLENPNLSPTLKASLLAVPFGKPITVTGLDARLGLGTSWKGFVEGWQLRLSKARKELVLYVSARKFSIPLATIDPIYTAINALTGSINDLADLWSSQLKIDNVSDTINSVTGTYNSAYTIGT